MEARDNTHGMTPREMRIQGQGSGPTEASDDASAPVNATAHGSAAAEDGSATEYSRATGGLIDAADLDGLLDSGLDEAFDAEPPGFEPSSTAAGGATDAVDLDGLLDSGLDEAFDAEPKPAVEHITTLPPTPLTPPTPLPVFGPQLPPAAPSTVSVPLPGPWANILVSSWMNGVFAPAAIPSGAQLPGAPQCDHGHPLEPYTYATFAGFGPTTCNRCSQAILIGASCHHCRACSFDLCGACAAAPSAPAPSSTPLPSTHSQAPTPVEAGAQPAAAAKKIGRPPTFDASRLFGKRAKAKEGGDLSLTLRELALRQVVRNFDEVAAAASVTELEEFANEMSWWPPDLHEWLLPRIDWRILAACSKCGLPKVLGAAPGSLCAENPDVFTPNSPEAQQLRLASTGTLIEAAIRRGERRFRELRANRNDSADEVYPLLDVFGDWGEMFGVVEPPPLPDEQLLFARERATLVSPLSSPVFEPSVATFRENFDVFTGGLLRGADWSGIVAAGGAVLACALQNPSSKTRSASTEDEEYDSRLGYFEANEYNHFRRGTLKDHSAAKIGAEQQSPFASSSDVDIFLVGMTPSEALAKVQVLYNTVRRNFAGKVLAISSGSAVTFVCGFPRRNVQVVLKLYDAAADVLTSFDLDCCAFAFDGERVLSTARGVRAAATRINLVDLNRRSKTYESRLLKYALRGWAIGIDPSLYSKARVDQSFLDHCSVVYPKKGERGSRGLARLLIANRFAESRRFRASASSRIGTTGSPVPLSAALALTYQHLNNSQGSFPTDDRLGEYLERTVTGDETFNLNEARDLYEESSSGKSPLYTQGLIPWRLGWDAARIEQGLYRARASADHAMEWAEEMGERVGPRRVGTLVAGRTTSVLPSEPVSRFGYSIRKLLEPADFVKAAGCASFFPEPAAGFTDGIFVSGPPPLELTELVFKPAPPAGQEPNYWKQLGEDRKKDGKYKIGEVLEATIADNGWNAPASSWRRATVVSVLPHEEKAHDYSIKYTVIFRDDADAASPPEIELTYHKLRRFTPWCIVAAALIKAKVLPSSVLACNLDSMQWVKKRGCILRTALGSAEVAKVRAIARKLAKDTDLCQVFNPLKTFKLRPYPVGASDAGPGQAGVCAHCAKLLDEPTACALCKAEPYCGPACARAAWRVHQNVCRGCRVGDLVELHGLRQQPAFNGLVGTVVGALNADGRYPVTVEMSDGGRRSIKLKPDNLRPRNLRPRAAASVVHNFIQGLLPPVE